MNHSGQNTISVAQNQTKDAFDYKWSQRDTYESSAFKDKAKQWLLERYCGGNPEGVEAFLGGGGKKILDAGCGAAFSALLLFGEKLKHHHYVGIDISGSIGLARRRFEEEGIPGVFLQGNIMDVPFEDQSFDIVFSEGVLHHTDSVELAIEKLSKKLKAGGRFLFYVYGKKAVLREFTDDHIRSYLKDMTDEEAWESLKPLTKLGITLGETEMEIDIPEDIPFLGIKKGKMGLQRFFYWNICKLYYRPEFSVEEMNHVNFDWFRPLNCHRHTQDEIARYCNNAGLVIERMNIQEAGFTVVARK